MRDAIAWVASQRLQRRFVVAGTQRTYVLPEDLLNDLFGELELALKDDRDRPLTSTERAALDELLATLAACAPKVPLDGSVSNEHLTESDPAWATLRQAARRCLDGLGFELVSWEERVLSDSGSFQETKPS